MSNVIAYQNPGSAEVLKPVTRDLGLLGPGEIHLRQTVIGVNYIDVYHRNGIYALPLPAVPGVEAVGFIEAVGEDITGPQQRRSSDLCGIAGWQLCAGADHTGVHGDQTATGTG